VGESRENSRHKEPEGDSSMREGRRRRRKELLSSKAEHIRKMRENLERKLVPVKQDFYFLFCFICVNPTSSVIKSNYNCEDHAWLLKELYINSNKKLLCFQVINRDYSEKIITSPLAYS
jgi:hypothetical protein